MQAPEVPAVRKVGGMAKAEGGRTPGTSGAGKQTYYIKTLNINNIRPFDY